MIDAHQPQLPQLPQSPQSPQSSQQTHRRHQLKNFTLPTLVIAGVAAIAAASLAGNYYSLFSGTQTLKSGDIAAVYGMSESGKEKVDLYNKRFQANPSETVYIYSTSQQPIDQTVHFAAGNVTGNLNLQTIVQFSSSKESIGAIAQEYRVDEDTFKRRILAAAIQDATIQVSAKLDPVTFNSNIPSVAAKIQEVLQQQYGKMVKISEVKITGVADFGDSFNNQILQRTNLKLATDRELIKLKLIEKQQADLAAAQPKQVIPTYTTNTPLIVPNNSR